MNTTTIELLLAGVLMAVVVISSLV